MSPLPVLVRKFRLDPTAFDSTIRPRLLRRTLLFATAVVVLASLQLAFMASRTAGFGDSLPIVAPPIFLVLVVVMALRHRLALRMERQVFDSYELVLAPNALLCTMATAPSVEITRPEVTRIVAVPEKGLRIETVNRHKAAFVPLHLAGFDDARDHLSTWRAPEAPERNEKLKQGLVVALFLVGLVASALITDVWIAILPASLVATLAWIWLRRVIESKVLGRGAKVRLSLLFAPFIALPFVRIVMAALMELAP